MSKHMSRIFSRPVRVTVTSCAAVRFRLQSSIWMRVPFAPLGASRHFPTMWTSPVPVLANLPWEPKSLFVTMADADTDLRFDEAGPVFG